MMFLVLLIGIELSKYSRTNGMSFFKIVKLVWIPYSKKSILCRFNLEFPKTMHPRQVFLIDWARLTQMTPIQWSLLVDLFRLCLFFVYLNCTVSAISGVLFWLFGSLPVMSPPFLSASIKHWIIKKLYIRFY